MKVLYTIGEDIKSALETKTDFNFAFLFYPCGMEKSLIEYITFLNEKNVEVVAVSGGGVISNVLPFIHDNLPVCILASISKENAIITDIKKLEKEMPLTYLSKYSAIVFSDETVDLDKIANALKSRGVTQVMGGVAGSYMKGKHESKVFHNQRRISNIIILLNNMHFEISGKSVLGWKPVGVKGIITKAYEDTIYSIDDIPALDYVERFLGTNIDRYVEQFLFSFAIYKSNTEYVLAAIKSIDKTQGSLKIFHRRVTTGTRISLAIPDNINNFIKEELSAFNYEEIQYFNRDYILICMACIGRRAYLSSVYPFVLFKVTHNNNISFSGFFSNGEYNKIAYSKDYSYLNLTTSTVLIKEKQRC